MVPHAGRARSDVRSSGGILRRILHAAECILDQWLRPDSAHAARPLVPGSGLAPADLGCPYVCAERDGEAEGDMTSGRPGRSGWLRVALLALAGLTLAADASAWWNTSWSHRRKLTLNNSASTTSSAIRP